MPEMLVYVRPLCDNGCMRDTTQQTIYFDLDGTLYDLYNVAEWLPRITTNEDATAYAEGDCLYDLDALHAAIDTLIAKGFHIGVITWLAADWDMPNGFTREYLREVRRVKRAWVKKHLPQATEVHVVKYGTPKHHIAKTNGVLVDDNAEVRAKWNLGLTIDATDDILQAIERLVA